jgi:hypothetical protein
MNDKELLNLALEALENSVDLVREDAYEAEKLYGNYPTRQGKVAGLKVLADDHEKAITAIKQALNDASHLAAPVQEPVAIYQYQLANGSWIDQDKFSYDYNVRLNQATVRIVYTTLPTAPDLLEVVKQMQSALSRCFGAHSSDEGDRHRALATARAIIGKATGENK